MMDWWCLEFSKSCASHPNCSSKKNTKLFKLCTILHNIFFLWHWSLWITFSINRSRSVSCFIPKSLYKKYRM